MTVQVTVTLQVMGGLVCLGLLLRAYWIIQALQAKVRQLTEDSRRLNDQWAAVRTARTQRRKCPCCTRPPFERDWYFPSTIMEERADND